MTEDYFNKVALLIKYKYDIEKHILYEYSDEIEQCFTANFSPRRTTEFIAKRILS